MDRSSHAFSVLLGDDDVAVRDSVVELLADRPLEIVAVGSGLDALRVLLFQPIDLIILDVDMPGMTGLEVLEHYLTGPWIAGPEGLPAQRLERRRLPTIFMSGNRDEQVHRACRSLGDTFVGKPLQAHALRSAVDRILTRLAR